MYNIEFMQDQVNLQAPFLVDEKWIFLVLKKCRGIWATLIGEYFHDNSVKNLHNSGRFLFNQPIRSMSAQTAVGGGG